jgi:hypothetical protein
MRTFTMPANDVEITAAFGSDNAQKFAITVTQPDEGGTFTVQVGDGAQVSGNTEADEGETITLRATAAGGWQFSAFNVNGASLAGSGTERTFKMPAQAVSVTASFMQNVPVGGSHNFLQGGAPGAWKEVLAYKRTALTAGKTYEYGIRYKGNVSPYMRFDLGVSTGNWYEDKVYADLTRADIWTEYSVTFEPTAKELAGSGITENYFYLLPGDSPSGSFAIDEVWLYETTDQTKTNLLVNGDFADKGTVSDYSGAGGPPSYPTAGRWYKHSSWSFGEHGVLYPINAVTQPTAGGTFTVGGAAAKTFAAEAGTVVSLAAAANLGYEFDHFDISGASLNSGSGSTRTFNMPAGPVTVTAVYNVDDKPIPINVTQAQGGSFTVKVGSNSPVSGNTTAAPGTLVTLAASPSAGYRFAGFRVRDGTAPVSLGGSGTTRTFTMPLALSISVTAIFEDQNAQNDPKSKFHIYIAIGQSNMEAANGQGWDAFSNYKLPAKYTSRFQVLQGCTGDGSYNNRQPGQWYPANPPMVPNGGVCPTDYFGRYLVDNISDEDVKIGVIVIALGGQSLKTWHPDDDQSWVNTYPDPYYTRYYTNDCKHIYLRMVQLAQQAQEVGTIKGILVHQGEGGTPDSWGGWAPLLKSIYDHLLNDLSLEPNSIPLLAGQPSNTGGWAYGNPGYGIMNFNTDPLYPDFYGISTMVNANGTGAYLPTVDGVHFTNTSQEIIGTRYGEKMLELMDKYK